MDSTSGQLEPASGARASIPGREYWPEGTASRVAAARAPEPPGKSDGKPSYGKNPGSRRRKYKGQATASEAAETISDMSNQPVLETSGLDSSVDEPKDPSEAYVIYQTEPEQENMSSYELDKEMGRPHPFVDPALDKPIEEPRTSEDLWWNWRKPEKEQWSRWQRRRPDVDTKRLEEIGPIAYYSEWVKAWDRDTSREAVQKHYEETGEDENIQLIKMFEHQAAEEYRIMMGTDIRIKRDPLAMRMREDQIKESMTIY
ncbi:hypothetical protein GW17_00018300 [Ensete ventricosum]|nr:hypothetical protein GW17_00018300 [Ensete ventricosum]RZS21476.1 hypothetical protein BHM03_00054129 [Ensete ventricosum]